LFSAADISADPVHLVGGYIKFIPAGVLEYQKFSIHVVITNHGEPEKPADAVLDVHHIIVRLNIRKDFMTGN